MRDDGRDDAAKATVKSDDFAVTIAGLVPIMIGHWHRSEVMQRIAVVGGIIPPLLSGMIRYTIAKFPYSFLPERVRCTYLCLEELCCDQQHVRQSCQVWYPYWNFECQLMSGLEIMQPTQREIDEDKEKNGQGGANAQQRVKW